MTPKTYADFGIDVPPGTGEKRAICPQCNPTRKPEHRREQDLSVNRTEGTWFCHHCGWSGGLGTTPNGYGTREKVYESPKPIQPAPRSDMEHIYDWFERTRGISRTVVDRNQITAIRGTSGALGIAFPYLRSGTHVHTTYRLLERKSFYQSTGTERIYYGLDGVDPDVPYLIVVEGQIDKLSFNEAGFTNVLSVPDGAPAVTATNYTSKFTFHDSASDLFDAVPTVYLACDSDEPGQRLTEELARRIGREKCKLVTWPEGVKDANDLLVLSGPGAIISAIANARPYPVEGIVQPYDIEHLVLDLYDNGTDPGLRLGLPKLDDLFRVRPGALVVVTGHSYHGKSLWLDHIMSRYASRHGWRIAMFSPENAPLRRHYAQLLEIHLGKPFDRRYGGHMSREEVIAATPFMDEHFSFILPKEMTLDCILDRAETLVRQRGLNALVIDPWNHLERGTFGGLTETQFTNAMLAQITQFRATHDVAVFLMAHPTKIMRDKDGKELVPQLDHINGSIHFRNFADFGISIYRDLDPDKAGEPSQCHVLKVRDRDLGRHGMVPFRYHWPTRTMEEA